MIDIDHLRKKKNSVFSQIIPLGNQIIMRRNILEAKD